MSDYLSRPETSGSDRAENSTKFPAITKRDDQHTMKLFEESESLVGESTEQMIHHAPYSQTVCSANSEHMQILRKGFEISKSRMSELSKTPAGHLHLQLHGANANRVYNALSTLLYGSISVYKADELERYIRKKSKTLPSSVFNIDDWDQILSIARDARMGDLAILKQDIDAQKQDILVRSWMTTSAAIAARAQVLSLKDGVENDLADMRSWMAQLGGEIHAAIEQYMAEEVAKSNESQKRLTDALITAEEIRQQLVERQLSETKLQKYIADIKEDHIRVLENMSTAHTKELASRDEAASEAAVKHLEEFNSLQDSVEARIAQVREENGLTIANLKEAHVVEVDRLLQEVAELKQARNDAVESIKTVMESESSRSDRRIAEMESTHVSKLTELREIMETEKVALRLQISALEAANQELRASITAMAGTHGELVANESEKGRQVASLMEEIMQLKLQVQEATSHSTHTGALLAHEMDVLRERLARETSDLEVTREKLNAAELTINSLNEQKNQLECQVASESATASTLKETIREGDVALKTVQQQYNDAVQKTALLEVELRSLRESVSSSSEMHGQLQAQVNAVREEKVALVSRCETLSKELEFTKQELTVAARELEVSKQQFVGASRELEDAKTELEVAKKEAMTAKEALSALKVDVSALQKQLDTFHKNKSTDSESRAALENKVSELENALAEAKRASSEAKVSTDGSGEVVANSVETETAAAYIEQLQSQIQLMEIQIADLKASQKKLMTERGSSRSLKASASGMNIAVKTVRQGSTNIVTPTTPMSSACNTNPPPTERTNAMIEEDEKEDSSHAEKEEEDESPFFGKKVDNSHPDIGVVDHPKKVSERVDPSLQPSDDFASPIGGRSADQDQDQEQEQEQERNPVEDVGGSNDDRPLFRPSASGESAVSVETTGTTGTTGTASSGVRWAVTAALMDPSDETKVVLLADHYRVLEEVQAEYQREIEEILAAHGDEMAAIISDRIPIEDHTRLIKELQKQQAVELSTFAELSKEKVDEIELEAKEAVKKHKKENDDLRKKIGKLEKQLNEARLHLYDAVTFGESFLKSGSKQDSQKFSTVPSIDNSTYHHPTHPNIAASIDWDAAKADADEDGTKSIQVEGSRSPPREAVPERGDHSSAQSQGEQQELIASLRQQISVLEQQLVTAEAAYATKETALKQEVAHLEARVQECQDLYAANEAALQTEIHRLEAETNDFKVASANIESALKAEIEQLGVKLKNASEANLHNEDRLRAEIRRLEGRLVESQNEKRLPAAPADDEEAQRLALKEELEEKTRLLVVTTEELAKSKKAFEGLTARAALDISGLHAQIASLQEDVKKAEKKLREEDNKKAIEEATKKLSMRHIVLVQAAVRGFIKRVEVQRTKLFHSARLSGVLVALKTHQQGQTGWYVAPNGLLYYFLLDKEEWVLTAGPITREQYESTVKNCRRAGSNKNEPILVKCGFNLAVDHSENAPGEVYMQQSTEKLFIGVDVVDYMMGHHSSMSYLSGSQSLVEGASLVLEVPSSPMHMSTNTTMFDSTAGGEDRVEEENPGNPGNPAEESFQTLEDMKKIR